MSARSHAGDDTRFKEATRLARYVIVFSAGGLILAVLCLAAAFFWPLDISDDGAGAGQPVTSCRLPEVNADVSQLVGRLAGVRIIRPAQLRAAVKDSGMAARLAKQLKLQGVVDMRGKLMAYIAVEKQGVATVAEGDQVLDFLIERIEPGRVTLVLEGVSVELTH